ncbi:MAG: glycosyltransferase family 4 protein [Actinomycetota bacterium]|nr:glycosyltransferase family 4 protein [Actinomycetota bacterium]
MRIAQIAPMYEAVPPSHYGGTERVVWSLCEELVRRGHDVTLFASGDSRTSARLVPSTPRALRRRMTAEEMIEVAPHLHLRLLSDVYLHTGPYDVIHSHLGHLTLPFVRFAPVPTVTTMHGRLDVPPYRSVLGFYPEASLVSISMSQRLPVQAFDLNWVGCVYNGIVLDHFPFQARHGSYLLFVGRISPEKRPDWAVEVAARAGLPLVVGAKIDPLDQAYWEDRIEPLFRRHDVEFLGEVNEQEKAQLMGGAYALLFPIDWPEPFGMVMVESLACGTPVLAMRRGSVVEVLRHGRDGFVCRSLDEMVEAVPRVADLDRRTCRRQGERFSSTRMATDYERIYEAVLAQKALEELEVMEPAEAAG